MRGQVEWLPAVRLRRYQKRGNGQVERLPKAEKWKARNLTNTQKWKARNLTGASKSGRSQPYRVNLETLPTSIRTQNGALTRVRVSVTCAEMRG
jgi:hypothetical protein